MTIEYDYDYTDDETGVPVAREGFAVLAFRGSNLIHRESWAFFVESGDRARSILEAHEEEGFFDYVLSDYFAGKGDKICEEGSIVIITGVLVFSECEQVCRAENIEVIKP